jgi:hypothetical protein
MPRTQQLKQRIKRFRSLRLQYSELILPGTEEAEGQPGAIQKRLEPMYSTRVKVGLIGIGIKRRF